MNKPTDTVERMGTWYCSNGKCKNAMQVDKDTYVRSGPHAYCMECYQKLNFEEELRDRGQPKTVENKIKPILEAMQKEMLEQPSFSMRLNIGIGLIQCGLRWIFIGAPKGMFN